MKARQCECDSVANLSVFPRIWACFFVDLRFFMKTCRLLVFGLVLIKIACFLQVSVLRIDFLSNFMAILLFQCIAKRNLGVFLCIFAHFGLVLFGFASLFLYLINLLVLCFFKYSYKRVLGLFFR